jgi:hypothetical protein
MFDADEDPRINPASAAAAAPASTSASASLEPPGPRDSFLGPLPCFGAPRGGHARQGRGHGTSSASIAAYKLPTATTTTTTTTATATSVGVGVVAHGSDVTSASASADLLLLSPGVPLDASDRSVLDAAMSRSFRPITIPENHNSGKKIREVPVAEEVYDISVIGRGATAGVRLAWDAEAEELVAVKSMVITVRILFTCS